MLVLGEAEFMLTACLSILIFLLVGSDVNPLISCRYDVAMFLTHRFLSSGEAVSL